MDTTLGSRPPGEVILSSTPHTGRRLRVLAVVMASIAALMGAGWWLTHPQVMQPVGVTSDLPLEVGQVAVVGMFAQPRTGTVRLTDAVPNVIENTADAELRVVLCETAVGEAKVGSAFVRAEDACLAVYEPRGHELAGQQQQYLVLEILPRRPGAVVVEGLRVSHQDGWRRGTEVSGLAASFPVS